jgi:hypothetical protein
MTDWIYIVLGISFVLYAFCIGLLIYTALWVYETTVGGTAQETINELNDCVVHGQCEHYKGFFHRLKLVKWLQWKIIRVSNNNRKVALVTIWFGLTIFSMAVVPFALAAVLFDGLYYSIKYE